MIYQFSEKDIPEIYKIGGKAKALMEMTNAAFPVPGGFVLSIEFFDKWLVKVKESDEFKTALASISL